MTIIELLSKVTLNKSFNNQAERLMAQTVYIWNLYRKEKLCVTLW